MTIHLNHVKNGLDCMSFLRKEREYERAPTPDLILLDLNMPVMDGRAVLEAISEDKTLSHLPVIILTTSENEKDIYEMYRLRCSSYIVKPVDFAQFLRVIKQLSEYWFDIVVLPPLTH
jgi:two-component system response regulator